MSFDALFAPLFAPPIVLSEGIHWNSHHNRSRPGHHALFLTQHNGKLSSDMRTSRTTNEAVSIMQNFSLVKHVVIQGFLPPESPERSSIRATTGYDTNLNVRRDNAFAPAGTLTWIESLMRSPSQVHYVVFQGLLITEDALLCFLETSPFLTALIIWEPVDPGGKYIPIITDKIINRLIRRPDLPLIMAKNKTSSEPANRNVLPNLTHLELNGALTFDHVGFVDMLQSRCKPSWLRTGIGLVPSVELQSLCLHFHEACMDQVLSQGVQELFTQEGREFFLYEDNNPNIAKVMEDEELSHEMTLMFDRYIDPNAYLA